MNGMALSAHRMGELEIRGLRSRLVVLQAPWAHFTNEGNLPNVWSLGPTISEANALFDRYYSYLETNHKVEMIKLPPDCVVTGQDHKWGPAPYHYIDEAYMVFRKGIEDFVERC